MNIKYSEESDAENLPDPAHQRGWRLWSGCLVALLGLLLALPARAVGVGLYLGADRVVGCTTGCTEFEFNALNLLNTANTILLDPAGKAYVMPVNLFIATQDHANDANIVTAFQSRITGGYSYLYAQMDINPAGGLTSWLEYSMMFVRPNQRQAYALPWPLTIASMDTDGDGTVTQGVHEVVQFGLHKSLGSFNAATDFSPGLLIQPTTPFAWPGDQSYGYAAFETAPCTGVANDAALETPTDCSGAGAYPTSNGAALGDWTKLTARYPAGVSDFRFAYGGRTSPNGSLDPARNNNNNVRSYAMNLQMVVPDTDMKPDAISCTPTPAQQGQAISCTVVCRNIGPDRALFPSCNLRALRPDSSLITPTSTSAECGTLAGDMTKGTADEQLGLLASGATRSCSISFTPDVIGSYTLIGGTGAVNDSNGANVETAGNNPVNATLPVRAATDMAISATLLPQVGPGLVSRGTLSCRNTGSAAALNVTCAPATLQTDKAVVLSWNAPGCTVDNAAVTLPLASLAAGKSIECGFTYTAPGVQGGTDAAASSLVLTALTSADNDTTPANNSTSATAVVIDALDDGQLSVSTLGGSVDLLANDQLGSTVPPLAGSVVPTLLGVNPTIAGLAFDANLKLVVPAGLAVGSYQLQYRLCVSGVAPVGVPQACDEATATLAVTAALTPDLTISKTHSPATFVEGRTGVYTITVRNIGLGATQGSYAISDPLPAGLSVAAPLPVAPGWDCSATQVGATTLNCSSSTVLIQNASSAALALTVQVAANACANPDQNGQCQIVNTVTVAGGNEPQGIPAVLANNSASDPTTLQKSGAIAGTAWIDANHDRVRNGAETAAAGLIVEIWQNGALLDNRSRTDAGGAYRVDGLVPGSGYGVRFRDPGTQALYGPPISNDPAGGNDPSAQPGSGVVAGMTIEGLSVPVGAVRINQNLPLDPSGVVYSSASRTPLAGAQVELLTAAGAGLPGNCVVGGSSSLTTAVGAGGLDGAYAFQLVNPAPNGCPGAADYQLRVTPPAGYTASTTLPAQSGTLLPPAGCAGSSAVLCAVQAQASAPSGNQPTTYYLQLHLDPAGLPVVANHIPLDVRVIPGLLVSKTADRRQVEIGDSLRYSISVRRTDSGLTTLPLVELIDRLPAGMRYIAGTARIASGTTAAVALPDPAGAPGPLLRFSLGALPAGGTLLLSYRVRVDAGALMGDRINRAQVTVERNGSCAGPAASATCSNEGQHQVEVSGGVFSSEACVLGKIYVDCNGNHLQDGEEFGIPGVRLYLLDGTSLISDSEGKYSVCGLTPRTNVLAVDQTTLPRGSRLKTSSSRNAGVAGSLFLDLKSGELQRADFIEGSCSNTVLEQVKARRSRGEVRAAETEKRGGRVLKFDGKPLARPPQATDSADQRGSAAGQGEPGSIKPRLDGGRLPPRGALTDTTETQLSPVHTMPTSSGATGPEAAPARPSPASSQP